MSEADWDAQCEVVLDAQDAVLDALWGWDMKALGPLRVRWIQEQQKLLAIEDELDGAAQK